jgi:hypothetical protein
MAKPSFNLLHMSVLSRLGLAGLICGLIWACVIWAISVMGVAQ